MKVSEEEKIMYQVMMAIYKSGIPMSFKGSMVLKACLWEAGYSEETRHTVDIDGNWISNTVPTQEQIANSIQKALEQNGIDLKVNICREFGPKRSAGLELLDKNEELLFSMDVDVNRPVSSTHIYEINGLTFLGSSASQMIADKLSSISTDKIFRRIKDVIDLYYLSQVFTINKSDILQALKDSDRTLDDFTGFLYRVDELEHSYDKFRFSGNINKPPFKNIYNTVKEYIQDFLPEIQSRDNYDER